MYSTKSSPWVVAPSLSYSFFLLPLLRWRFPSVAPHKLPFLLPPPFPSLQSFCPLGSASL